MDSAEQIIEVNQWTYPLFDGLTGIFLADIFRYVVFSKGREKTRAMSRKSPENDPEEYSPVSLLSLSYDDMIFLYFDQLHMFYQVD